MDHHEIAKAVSRALGFPMARNPIEATGNRSPMTVKEFVIGRRNLFDRNGPQFIPSSRNDCGPRGGHWPVLPPLAA
jgi:hypothetical protein